ncbi:hypothetical protein, partial [Pseudomonas poae]
MAAPTLFAPITALPPKQNPIFIGNSSPGARVTVCKSGNPNEVLANAVADVNGCWLVRSDKELALGQQYSISAYCTPKEGYAPDLKFFLEPAGLPPGSAPTLTSPTTVNSQRPLLKGKAAANAIVYVYLAGGSVLFGKPQANANGEWELQLV